MAVTPNVKQFSPAMKHQVPSFSAKSVHASINVPSRLDSMEHATIYMSDDSTMSHMLVQAKQVMVLRGHNPGGDDSAVNKTILCGYFRRCTARFSFKRYSDRERSVVLVVPQLCLSNHGSQLNESHMVMVAGVGNAEPSVKR